MPITNAPYI